MQWFSVSGELIKIHHYTLRWHKSCLVPADGEASCKLKLQLL